MCSSLAFYIAAVALVLPLSVPAQVTLVAPCNQSLLQAAASGSWVAFPDMGHSTFCANMGGQYCTAYLHWRCVHADGGEETLALVGDVSTKGGPVVGMCVPPPSECSTAELARQVLETTSTDAAFQDFAGGGSLIAGPYPSRCTNASCAYLTVDCMADDLTIDGDGAAIAVTAVLSVLAALALALPLWRVTVYLFRMVFPLDSPPKSELASPSTASPSSPLVGASPKTGTQQSDEQSALLSPSHVAVPIIASQPTSATFVATLNDVPSTIGAVYGVVVAEESQLLPPSTTVPSKPTICSRLIALFKSFLQWFDIWANWHDLVTVTNRGTPATHTQFFEGFRTVAMALIINCHWGYYSTVNLVPNRVSTIDFVKSYSSIVTDTGIAVDVFFFLSGFLQLHIYFRDAAKVHGLKAGDPLRPLPVRHVLKNYLRRYLRLTPVVMVLLAAATWLVPYVPTGPMRLMYGNELTIRSCREDWWRVMLFINNLDDGAGWRDCLDWLWYLACDMQLYVAAPVFILPYFVPRIGERLWVCLALLTVFTVTICTIFYQPIDGVSSSFQSHYDKPYLRCIPYIYGMLTTVLVRRKDVRAALQSSRVRLAFYTLSLAAALSAINVYARGYRVIMDTMNANNSFLKFANPYTECIFGLTFLFVSLPWCCGHGGALFRFFSHPTFCVLSRLVFTAYVVHPVVYLVVAASQSHYQQLHLSFQLYAVGGATVISIVTATALHLLVEVPFSKINDALTR